MIGVLVYCKSFLQTSGLPSGIYSDWLMKISFVSSPWWELCQRKRKPRLNSWPRDWNWRSRSWNESWPNGMRVETILLSWLKRCVWWWWKCLISQGGACFVLKEITNRNIFFFGEICGQVSKTLLKVTLELSLVQATYRVWFKLWISKPLYQIKAKNAGYQFWNKMNCRIFVPHPHTPPLTLVM